MKHTYKLNNVTYLDLIEKCTKYEKSSKYFSRILVNDKLCKVHYLSHDNVTLESAILIKEMDSLEDYVYELLSKRKYSKDDVFNLEIHLDEEFDLFNLYIKCDSNSYYENRFRKTYQRLHDLMYEVEDFDNDDRCIDRFDFSGYLLNLSFTIGSGDAIYHQILHPENDTLHDGICRIKELYGLNENDPIEFSVDIRGIDSTSVADVNLLYV